MATPKRTLAVCIKRVLGERWLTEHDIAFRTGSASRRPELTRELKRLADAGEIRRKREGRQFVYAGLAAPAETTAPEPEPEVRQGQATLFD